MYFSDLFEIADPAERDWFDPILDADTKLFIDPFLIFKEAAGPWGAAHEELISYFHEAFALLARTYDHPQSLGYKQVLAMMTFPEPDEFGLGYVSQGTRGAGTGDGFARLIVSAMVEAIERGLYDLRHFEELGVLVPGINRDRISDITANVLKPRFISYTQDICTELDVPMESIMVAASEFDPRRRRWLPAEHALPVNPRTGKGIILTPKRFLRELPTLNSYDWYYFAEPALRDDLNIHILEQVDKSEIIRLARSRAELVREWTEAREALPAEPYDVDRDPAGLYLYDRAAQMMVSAYPPPTKLVSTTAELDALVKAAIILFKQNVEHEGGWKLLWNDDSKKPKREEAIQLLFKAVVQYFVKSGGVALDREVELGRGPVDFIFTQSVTNRLLMEVKKMSNSSYWDGLEAQLVSYMKSDQCKRGWFLAVRFSDSPAEKFRTDNLAARTKAAAKASGFHLASDWVDARPKASASKI